MLENVEVIVLPGYTVAYIKHVGAYSKMGDVYDTVFKELYEWASENGIGKDVDVKSIVIHHDDPTVTPDDKQRTSICITVPKDTPVAGKIGKMDIPGGLHLVARFKLQPDEIGKAWEWIYRKWFPKSQFQPGDSVPFQLYPQQPENGIFVIDFCVPLKPL